MQTHGPAPRPASLETDLGMRPGNLCSTRLSRWFWYMLRVKNYYCISHVLLVWSILPRLLGFPDGTVVKNLPANAGDMDSIPGLGISPGEENGNWLQYSCLGNPTDRVWWLQSMGSQKSQTRLSNWNNLDYLSHLILCDLDNHGISPHLSKTQRLFSTITSNEQSEMTHPL